MRILLINNAYPTEDQVCAVWMKHMADLIQAAGHHVDLLVIHGYARNRLWRLVQYIGFYLRFMVARLGKYDCIYLHHPSHCYLPMSSRRLRDVKLVVHLHGADLLPPRESRIRGRILQAITLRACRRADLVVTPSQFFAETLKKTVVPRRLHVYPSGGVDAACFAPGDAAVGAAGTMPLRIVAVAQLEKGKGVDVLLRALPGFSRPYELTVVGDGREAQSLADLAERLHIGSSVRFVGAVPHAQVANYLRVHDVFVFPTRLPESLGLVAVEAMACGVPVIGSRVGALPEYIRDGVNGFLFECGNETELAQRLELLSALDPEQRRAMSRNARKCAEQYDGENCTSELLRVFHEVTGQAA